MTGFGRGEFKDNGIELTCEVKSVNNRYLDVSIKAPKVFASVEDDIRSKVKERMTRGHLDIFISYTDKRERQKTLILDEELLKAYVAAAQKAESVLPEIKNDLTLSYLLRIPDVLKSEELTQDDEELKAALFSALQAAITALNSMRSKEGEKLENDMLSRMDEIRRLVEAIKKKAPKVAEEHRKKLETRMKKILEEREVDETRLLSEVAIFADKSNIDEELTRLDSHIEQFKEICSNQQVGRKLDFLVQEFNREANTICSKSNDLEVTRLALSLKNEIEKVREQVQNIE